MTIFSHTASLGQRWKIFLSGAASIHSDRLSTSNAAALIRKQWLSGSAGRSQVDFPRSLVPACRARDG